MDERVRVCRRRPYGEARECRSPSQRADTRTRQREREIVVEKKMHTLSLTRAIFSTRLFGRERLRERGREKRRQVTGNGHPAAQVRWGRAES